MAKHTVILKEDAKKYLSMKSQYRLKMMIDAINLGRESDGREPIEALEVDDYEYSQWFDRGRR
ncbi:hypothetical protein [Salinicoccus sp. Marseille-QA3877]